MNRIIVILILAALPSLLYLWVVRKTQQRFQRRMRRLRHQLDRDRFLRRGEDMSSQYDNLFGQSSDFIGDISCCFNARSPYLRCAVNPSGPCKNCPSYTPMQ